jgi:hypothetical protein
MAAKYDRNAALNTLGGFFGGYGITAIVCFFVLVRTWASAAPHTPDPSGGLIYPHNEHGWITYLSGFQGTSLWLLFYTSFPFAALGWYLLPKRNWVVRKTRFSIGSTLDWDDPHKLSRWGMLAGACSALVIFFMVAPPVIIWLNRAGFVVGF